MYRRIRQCGTGVKRPDVPPSRGGGFAAASRCARFIPADAVVRVDLSRWCGSGSRSR